MDLKLTIEEELEWKGALKVVITLHAAFHQATDLTFLTEPHPVIKSLPLEILHVIDIDQVLYTIIEQILKRVDQYEERGSGWVFHQLLRLDLHTYEYTPFSASTYILLSNDLKAKEAVVNIKNKL